MRLTRALIGSLAAVALLAACVQTANPTPSPSGTQSAGPAATGGAKPVDLRVIVPASGARAGERGAGWSVDVLARASDANVLGQFRPGLVTSGRVGHSTNFPGLVVLLSTATTGGGAAATASPTRSPASGSPSPTTSPSPAATAGGAAGQPNLAGLFQLFAITDDQTTSTAARATASPTATASASATSAASPARTTGSREVQAAWVVTDARFGIDVDVELIVFVVDGTAPDTVTDRSSLKIVSNEVSVRFHINDGGTTGASAAPSATASPASASPSASGSPSASPSASRSP
jgi:hypothetical protein